MAGAPYPSRKKWVRFRGRVLPVGNYSGYLMSGATDRQMDLLLPGGVLLLNYSPDDAKLFAQFLKNPGG